MYANPYFLAFFAAGNSGSGSITIGNPGLAKNCVTVGAVVTQSPISLAYFSSRGPTADGRYGVDVLAPGYFITSAAASGTTSSTCNTLSMAGTSMATPATGIYIYIINISVYISFVILSIIYIYI